MASQKEFQLISDICESILSLNHLEHYMIERIIGVPAGFKEAEGVYLDILLDNIAEFDIKISENDRVTLGTLKKKYGAK